jgi:2-polyprenyl-3-methyl-5-hydroxy-6-metoxy-1,4-benzoquinol methylase
MTGRHKQRVREHYAAQATSFGSPQRESRLVTWVRAREVLVVREMLRLQGGESILDAGCGPGVHAQALAARGHEVWAFDLAAEMVAAVDGHVARRFVADVETLRLGRTFDRVLCLGVMEFVADPGETLTRLRDHLAPGGRLIVLVPRSGPGGWIYRFAKARHRLAARLYAPRKLRLLGEAIGLRCVGYATPFAHNLVAAFEHGPASAAKSADFVAPLDQRLTA